MACGGHAIEDKGVSTRVDLMLGGPFHGLEEEAVLRRSSGESSVRVERPRFPDRRSAVDWSKEEEVQGGAIGKERKETLMVI